MRWVVHVAHTGERREEWCTQGFGGETRRKEPLGRPRHRWGIILQQVLNRMAGHKLDSSCSEEGQLVGRCAHGNEPPNSIKCGKFFVQLRKYQILNKDSVPWSQLLRIKLIHLQVSKPQTLFCVLLMTVTQVKYQVKVYYHSCSLLKIWW